MAGTNCSTISMALATAPSRDGQRPPAGGRWGIRTPDVTSAPASFHHPQRPPAGRGRRNAYLPEALWQPASLGRIPTVGWLLALRRLRPRM